MLILVAEAVAEAVAVAEAEAAKRQGSVSLT